MPSERFVASRWTRGNHLFPTVLEVTDTAIVRRRRSWFTKNEISIHLQRVASVHVETGLLWSNMLIESTGGTDPIASNGHRKADALRVRDLVEAAQKEHLPAGTDDSLTKRCPFCAETIKQAAKVCRFCGHELTANPA